MRKKGVGTIWEKYHFFQIVPLHENMKELTEMKNIEEELTKNRSYAGGYRTGSWFIVINEKAMNDLNITYETMHEYLQEKFPSLLYACWNEEVGDKGNRHIHLYMELSDKKRFSTIKNIFQDAHIDRRYGSPLEARTYIEKPEGVLFKGKEKSHTVVKPILELGNFEPFRLKKGYRVERDMKLNTQEKIEYALEKFDSYEEVVEWDIHFATIYRKNIEELFSKREKEKFIAEHCTIIRNFHGDTVTTVNRGIFYLHGQSRTGKTFGVLRKWGDKNVSLIGNLYEGMNMDRYQNTPVMVLDEFYSQFKLDTVLGILDDKLTELDCRYLNRLNLTHTIVLTSNWEFDKQYNKARTENPIAYKAFKNRFTGGSWELWRGANGIRYLACEWGYNPKYGAPIDIFDTSVRVVSVEQLKKLKQLDDGAFKTLPVNFSDKELERALESSDSIPFR